MRKTRVSYGALRRALDEAQGRAEALQSCTEELGDALVKARGQRDELRKFADRVDHAIGISRLMLEAGMPVRADFLIGVLDEALEDVCRKTGAVRTPMRQGMPREELAEASRTFLASLDRAEVVFEGVEGLSVDRSGLPRDRDEGAERASEGSKEDEKRKREYTAHRDSDTLPEPLDEKTREWALSRARAFPDRCGD
jgi:hypothetical protein